MYGALMKETLNPKLCPEEMLRFLRPPAFRVAQTFQNLLIEKYSCKSYQGLGFRVNRISDMMGVSDFISPKEFTLSVL